MSNNGEKKEPKLFISYCWSNPSHEQWVLDFATELRESGVDAILDKWDLKEGHDAIAFMKKMVTDPEIKKVAIVSNADYAKKADDRKGGVGTETQIISKEIYENQDQDKFVAVVVEKTDDNKPYLPTYYKSRIYIDLCDAEKYSENFEKLLRWIFNKPLYIKPELGKKPSFLNESESIQIGTSAKYKRVIDAIKNNKVYSVGALNEYLVCFVEGLEKFRIKKTKDEFDDLVIDNIKDFLPYRNEAINLFITISQYSSNKDHIESLHIFFESLLPYLYRPENVKQWNEWDFDNYLFIIHELFLYLIAILLKYKKFEWASYFLEQNYYLTKNSYSGNDVMKSFLVFREYMRSFEYRNNRLKLRRLSIRADLLKERCIGTGIDFKDIMQADFILFLRAELETKNKWGGSWWPETLLYLGHYYSVFEIFARASSKKYFNRIKCLLGINSPEDLNELFKLYQERKRELPRWEYNSFNPSILVGYDKLATIP